MKERFSFCRQLFCASPKVVELVAPYFEYCASCLRGAGDVYLSKLQILQNRGMRSILNSRYDKSINKMLTQLGWLYAKQKLALSIVFTYQENYQQRGAKLSVTRCNTCAIFINIRQE
jgi:hypothetical protein